ncbi:polysaccharide biosynthesis/export family protein [Methylobacterium sp. A54F]
MTARPDRTRAGRSLLLALAATLCATGALGNPSAGAEDYRLQSGDVLEFSVAGIATMRERFTINVDGNVSCPLIGEVRAAGLTLAEVRRQIQAQLPKHSLSIRGNDGREVVTVVTAEEINLSIAENRPVYIKGDVAKPGEMTYRPGMTVRQVVALAGGYDLVRFKTENPIIESANLKADYESLWTDYARVQAAILRLRAELDGQPAMDRKALANIPLPMPVLDAIFRNEQEQFNARGADYTREKAHIQKGVRMMDDRIGVLTEQRGKEEEGAAIDASEIERINDLQRRGVVPVTRQVETRRLSLVSATRALQIATTLEEVKRSREDLARSSQRLDDQRRADLSKDLQENTVKLTQTRFRIAAVGEKMLYTGIVKSQLVRDTGGDPQIVVHRIAPDGRSSRIEGGEDTSLRPGDTVDVTLRIQRDVTDATR